MSPTTADDFDGGAGTPRAVLGGAFALLLSLRRLDSARVSEVHRDSGLPRTTVHRLLAHSSTGVPAPVVAATRRIAGRIASELSQPARF